LHFEVFPPGVANSIGSLLLLLFIFSGFAAQPGYGFLVSRGSLITQNDAPQSVGPSGRVISPSQRPLPDKTQQTKTHAPGGIFLKCFFIQTLYLQHTTILFVTKHESLVAHATAAGTTEEGKPLHSENIQIITNSPLPFGT
jgi:hypothetical protein